MTGPARSSVKKAAALRRVAVAIALQAGFAGFAAAQAPHDLKWWNDAESAVQTRPVAKAFVPATTRPADSNRVSRGPASATAVRRSDDLRWWETERKAEELNWWKAKRESQTLGWWNDDATHVKPVSAQQNPFEKKSEPAVPPAVRPLPREPRNDRTDEAEGVDFDPFLVVPPLKPLSQIEATIAPSPVVIAQSDNAFTGTADEYFATKGNAYLAPRVWPQRTPEAAAYQFYSRPLWFEDANVERCGETVGCLQPVVSGTYFFANTLLIPYRFAAEPQCTTVPQKGFCPPGCRYTHAQNYLPPWSPAGVVAEGAAVTGLIFLVP